MTVYELDICIKSLSNHYVHDLDKNSQINVILRFASLNIIVCILPQIVFISIHKRDKNLYWPHLPILQCLILSCYS